MRKMPNNVRMAMLASMVNSMLNAAQEGVKTRCEFSVSGPTIGSKPSRQ